MSTSDRIQKSDTTYLPLYLRKAFVRELLNNRHHYQLFVEYGKDYEFETNKFLQSGYYDNSLGDCMPLAMANILQASITIFSIYPEVPLYVTPTGDNFSNATLFLVHRPEISHYDAALPHNLSNASTAVEHEKPGTQVHCNCGVNKKDSSLSCCSFPICFTM